MPRFPMLPCCPVGARLDGVRDRGHKVCIYQSQPIDRLVLFVVGVFYRRVVGNLNGIKWDDHERKASLGLKVREGGR